MNRERNRMRDLEFVGGNWMEFMLQGIDATEDLTAIYCDEYSDQAVIAQIISGQVGEVA